MCMESVLAHLLNLLWCFRNKQHLPHLKKKIKKLFTKSTFCYNFLSGKL